NRVMRLSQTTCGVDCKVEAGLTAELISRVANPVLALYGEHSPFLATARYLVDHLPDCRCSIVPSAKHRAPEENPEDFVRLVREFLDHLWDEHPPGSDIPYLASRVPILNLKFEI